MTMRLSALVGAATLVCGLTAVLGACGGGGQNSKIAGVKNDFPVAATTGDTPVFTWPGGNATGLVVFVRDPDKDAIWLVSGDFAPPVTFGKAPPGGEAKPPGLLLPNTRYAVGVVRSDGKGGNAVFQPTVMAAGNCTPTSVPSGKFGSCTLAIPDKGDYCADFSGSRFESAQARGELCGAMKGKLSDAPCKPGPVTSCLLRCGGADEVVNNTYFGQPDEGGAGCAAKHGTSLVK